MIRAFYVLAMLWVGCLGLAGGAAAQDDALKIGGTGGAAGTMQRLAAAFEKLHPEQQIIVLSSLGSTGGIKAVIAGAIDIGVSGRPPTDAEREQGATAIEYGRTPMVFAVSPAVTVSDVTLAQVIDIYAGRMTQWPKGLPVRLILRPATDVDTILLKSLSAQLKDAVASAERRPGMLFALTNQESMENIEKIPGSFGLGILSEILTTSPRLKILTLEGVKPSVSNIADGSYPLHQTYYFIVRPTPSAAAAQFIAFAQSEAGRKILADTGHWLVEVR